MINRCIECNKETDNKIYCSLICSHIESRRNFLLNEKNLEILTLALDGVTFSEISRIFNVSRERVRQIVAKYGLNAKDWEIKRNREVTIKISLCNYCGKEIVRRNKFYKFCSRKCHHDYIGNNLVRDDADRVKYPSNKYPKKKYKHKFLNGKTVLEHRYIMENYLHRKLKTNEHVHHIDGNGLNNNLENLILLNASDHARMTIKKEFSNITKTNIKMVENKKVTNEEMFNLTK